jgi:glucan 1,3-beta-glucosidase
MTGPVVEESNWLQGIYAGLLVAAVFMGLGLLFKAKGTHWIVLALSGYASGALLAAQCRHMRLANRYWTEWLVTGFWTVLALITTAWLAVLLARWLKTESSNQPPRPAIPSVALFPVAPDGLRWLGVVRAMWLFAVIVVDLLLVFDARYRDFPTLLFAAPVLGFVLLKCISLNARAGVEERLMAALIVVLGVIIVILELPVNTSAVLWVVFGFVFAATIPAWRFKTQAGQASHPNSSI